jgi:hypothetical protein
LGYVGWAHGWLHQANENNKKILTAHQSVASYFMYCAKSKSKSSSTTTVFSTRWNTTFTGNIQVLHFTFTNDTPHFTDCIYTRKTLHSIALLALTVCDISYTPRGHILNATDECCIDMKFCPTYAVLVSDNYSDIKSFLYSPNHHTGVL